MAVKYPLSLRKRVAGGVLQRAMPWLSERIGVNSRLVESNRDKQEAPSRTESPPVGLRRGVNYLHHVQHLATDDHAAELVVALLKS